MKNKENNTVTTHPQLHTLALPEGVPELRCIYLYATTGCNLCCRHCWITPTFVDGKSSTGDCIPLDLLKRAVKEAKPLGLTNVKLTGGEPMIHPQFKEIATFLKAEDLQSNMETNGTMIDHDIARFIKAETSIQFISVSLDSVHAESHDQFRGVNGAFERSVAGIKHLVAAGIKPQVIMCPHRGNIGEIDQMVEFATQLGAGSVKFNPVTNAGRGSVMTVNDETLSYEETRLLAKYVYGDLQMKSHIRLFISMPPALLTVNDILNKRSNGQCNVRHIMGILGSGHMALCGIGRNVPELAYGNLVEDSLRDIWISHPLLKRIRKGLDGDFPGICGDCVHAYGCRTGCVAMNYMNGGDLFSPDVLCAEAEKRGEFPTTRRRSF